MRFRLATNQDKNIVFNFCKNTFSWGDYIDRVWDIWINEPNSRFLVAESENNIKKPIGIIHGILIPEKIVWIEGIRIDPEYRKKKTATNLINNILDYGRRNGALYSSAIVSIKNHASKKMMEKLNFEVVSNWSYISTTQITYSGKNLVDNKCKLADIDDYQQIVNYLDLDNVNGLGRTKFVDSWRWYNMTKDMILNMIYNSQIIIIIRKNNKDNSNNNQEIKGLAILDKERYHYNQNIIQIGYIDAESEELLSSLIANSIDLVLNDNRYSKDNNDNVNKIDNKYDKLQIFTPFRENNFRILPESNISFNEQFLLYSKKIE